jgi:hypothetical protein
VSAQHEWVVRRYELQSALRTLEVLHVAAGKKNDRLAASIEHVKGFLLHLLTTEPGR